MSSYLFIHLLCLLSGYVAGRLPTYMQRGGGLKAPYLPADTPLPGDQWIEQNLDQLGSQSISKWQQRYFVNSSWWDSEFGPVFILLGGEGPANPAWIVADTNIMFNAKKYSALVFSVEHRFYGKSHPTKDTSNENLQYLSSQQALADFAYFHDEMVIKYNMTERNKWIVFGGSYSGALAAWFRQMYPNKVVGAIASSAPVLAKLDFVEYVEVVEDSLLATSGDTCPTNVAIAAVYVKDLLENKTNWNYLEKLFNVAPPLSSQMDAMQLMSNLAGNFEGIVQYNKDNTAFEGRPNNITIVDLCNLMLDSNLGIPLLRYVAVNKYMNGNSSLDCSFQNQIKSMNEVEWDADAVAGGARQWTYQTCTEFGYFQTTNSNQSSLFANNITLEFFTEQCKQLFDISSDAVAMAVAKTNNFYGGKNVTGTSIVFPNGSIDPWHALGITEDLSSTQRAIFIQGTAHCANMYPAMNSDPAELTWARAAISNQIGEWLL